MKAGEFSVEILLKGAAKSLADLRKLSAGMKDLRFGLVAAVKQLNSWSEAARQMAVNLDMYQLNTGLSGEQLQKLAFRAAQAGVSMNELGGTIQHLQNLSARANLGEGWSPVLSRFGVMPNQDPVTQLNKISAALKRMQASAPAEARQLASEIGINDTVYYALMKGNTEEMNKQLVLTQKEQNTLVKLNFQWNKFWFYLKQISAKIQTLGAGLQIKFLDILTRAAQGAYTLYERFLKLVEANENLKGIVTALGAVLMAYFAPWLAVLIGIALALEDIFTYFEGGDSITGDIVNWVQQSETFLKTWEAIKTVVLLVWNALKMAGEGLKQLFAVLNDAGVFDWLLERINDIARIIIGLTKGPLVQWALKKAGFADEINGIADQFINRDAGVETIARPNIANSTSGDTNVSTNVYVNGSMTREDARQVGDTISSEIQDAQKQVSYHTVTGGQGKYESPVYA